MTRRSRLRVTEKDLQTRVLELARLMGWLTYFTWRSYHSPAGFPDLVLVRPPRLLFCELKSERGKVTEAQDGWLAQLEKVPGAEVFVWRPEDWGDIIEVLR